MFVTDRAKWYRYHVPSQTLEMFIDAVGMWGANREVVQMHTAADDRQHVFKIRTADAAHTTIGIGYYMEPGGPIRFYAAPSADEAHIDQSGRWTLVLHNDGNNEIYDNSTGVMVTQVSEGLGALGHTDAGWGYFVGLDNYHPQPGAVILRTTDPWTNQGLMHHNYDWDLCQMNHVALPRSTNNNHANQIALGSNIAVNSVYQNEVTAVRLDGNTQQLVVAPIMTDLNASGGGIDPYAKYPKGNCDVTGDYFIWTTNLSGNRLDAFVVEVPRQLLLDLTPPVAPSDCECKMSG